MEFRIRLLEIDGFVEVFISMLPPLLKIIWDVILIYCKSGRISGDADRPSVVWREAGSCVRETDSENLCLKSLL